MCVHTDQLLTFWILFTDCVSLPCSGRELFLSDSSLFVDDVEAHEKYQRDQEPPVAEQKVRFIF